MLHYGLYSLLGRGKWVMFNETIPVAEYSRLQQRFTASKFDADRITDVALAAGMRYVNITTRHHDGFCLFRTAQTDYQSLRSPARRDLVGELADACRNKDLGMFFYYSYGLDWHHPYYLPTAAGFKSYRPTYDKPEPSYLYRREGDFEKYIAYAQAQLRELLTQYGPVAGIWMDPVRQVLARPELFHLPETYALIRKLQPQCLISFKQGASGDEDFIAPEGSVHPLPNAGPAGDSAWAKNRDKPAEVCASIGGGWGYQAKAVGKHLRPDGVIGLLHRVSGQHANLLLNIGPEPDGALPQEDIATLGEVVPRLRSS